MPVNTAIRTVNQQTTFLPKVLFTGAAIVAIYYLIKIDVPPPVVSILQLNSR